MHNIVPEDILRKGEASSLRRSDRAMRRRIIHIFRFWFSLCGYCGHVTQRATDGSLIFCARCRH